MIRTVLHAALGIVFAGAAVATAPASAPSPVDRERLLAEPVIGAVSLAPDGRSIAFIRIAGDQRSLWLQSTDPGSRPRRLMPRAGSASIEWSADSRWLFLTDDQSVRALSLTGTPGSGTMVRLNERSKPEVLGVDRVTAGVLMIDEDDGTWRLWRFSPRRRPTLLAFSRRQIVDAAIDRGGRVAFAKLVDGDGHFVLARQPGGLFRTVADCSRMRRCDFLSVAADGSAFLASDLLGDRRGLVGLSPSGRLTSLADDPEGRADFKRIVLDRRTGQPRIAQILSTGPRLVGLDSDSRAGLARLGLEGVLAVETSSSAWLVRQEASDMQGERYYLFEPHTGRTRLALDSQPDRLPSTQLARTVAMTFPASDGVRLNGLLTLPEGRDPRRAPLVTLVHGGPWAHDEIGYSSIVQMLASRGMIVFQPQFRGSTGFGRRYVFAADGDYGDGRVQRDIEDGTRWLLAQGLGDPKRSAIVGASFGGYSTLQALSNGSDLYSVGVAIVPPTDFGWIIDWAADRTDLGEAQGVRFGAVQRILGLNRADPAVVRRLHVQSPRARVERMKTPLLILAAGRDERVPIRSVIDYAAALKAAKAPVRVVVAKNMKHSQKDVLGAKASLFLIEDLLARQWQTGPVAPPSAQVRQWMDANLRQL